MNKTVVFTIVAACLASVYLYNDGIDETSGTESVNQPCLPTTDESSRTHLNVKKPTESSMIQNSSVQKNVAAEEPLTSAKQINLESQQKTEEKALSDYAVSEYPEFFQGELSMLTSHDYYVRSVIDSNMDNQLTPWSKEFKNFIVRLDSYVASGISDEQIKCSSKSCLITAKVKSKSAAVDIYTELTEKHQLWGIGLGGEINKDGEYVLYISKSKMDEDSFYNHAQ